MKKYQHYINARVENLPDPHRNNDGCCDLKIIPMHGEKFYQLHTEKTVLELMNIFKYINAKPMDLSSIYLNGNKVNF